MRIVVDLANNLLRFEPVTSADRSSEVALPATIDVGLRGELVGVEVEIGELILAPGWRIRASPAIELDATGATLYLTIGDAPETGQRTADGTVIAALDAAAQIVAFDLPRRGAGYEISYPSGNQ